MAEPPRDPKRPPIPGAVKAQTDTKGISPSAAKTAKPAPHLPSLGESTQEALPLVMVDFGTDAPATIASEQTLILPAAKQSKTSAERPTPVMTVQPAVKAPPTLTKSTLAAPIPAGVTQAAKPVVFTQSRPAVGSPNETTLILSREDKIPIAQRPTQVAKAVPSGAVNRSLSQEPTLVKPALRPEYKTELKPEPRPEPKPEPKPEQKSELKPEPKQLSQPAHTAEAKTEARSPSQEAKPAASKPASVMAQAADSPKPSAHPLLRSGGPTQPPVGPPIALKGLSVPPQPPSKKQVQKRIRELIQRFDVPALMDALHHIGYRDDQIDFMSNPTLSHQGALLQDIEFLEHPDRVLVLTNLGLMSGQGPIPSYFYELLAEQRDSTMTEFLWFFDNALLQQRFSGQFPERDERVVPDWSEVKRLQLALLQLGSPMGMHWLFRQVYPELPISVRRSLQKRRVRTEGIQMGESQLGSGCAFGGFTQVPVGGIDVHLLCEDSSTQNGRAWANEAERRLARQILPALDHVDLFLTVTLVFLDRQSVAKLAAQHYLGYDPIAAPRVEEGPQPAQQVILFQGEVGQSPH